MFEQIMYHFLSLFHLQETTCAEKKVEILYSSRGYFSASQVSTGPSCSKLMLSLVNDSLKFQIAILQKHCYFLLKKCENPLQCTNNSVHVCAFEVDI